MEGLKYRSKASACVGRLGNEIHVEFPRLQAQRVAPRSSAAEQENTPPELNILLDAESSYHISGISSTSRFCGSPRSCTLHDYTWS